MTKYFTINVVQGQRLFYSAHYGTEMHLVNISDNDIVFLKNVMKEYSKEDFSVHIAR